MYNNLVFIVMKKILTFLWACMLFVTTVHAQTVDLQFASQETKLKTNTSAPIAGRKHLYDMLTVKRGLI